MQTETKATNGPEQRLIVTCAGGLEPFLLQEVQGLVGSEFELTSGVVAGPFSLRALYTLCLWSRIGSRILLPIAEFAYRNEQDFYHRLRQVHWQQYFSLDSSFAVAASKDPKTEINTQFMTYRTKDAIVDYFRQFLGDRPTVSTRQPDIRVHVHFRGDQAQVALDVSGVPLHQRGYRVAQHAAPLKETLAAAMLVAAGWPRDDWPRLVDPMCGSGTLLIEAAMMQAQMAPGLMRRRFGFEAWLGHDEPLWQSVVQEAVARECLETAHLDIRGYDADGESVQAALRNIAAAGLEGHIHVERRGLHQFRSTGGQQQTGLVVTNPPYGERLDSGVDLIFLYRALARTLQQHCPHWHAALITNQVEYADALQLEQPLTHRVFNGPIRCILRIGEVVPRNSYGCVPTPPAPRPEAVAGAPAPDLLNRIRKNLKNLQKWIQREQVLMYRLYDADIPEYNMAVDWYNGHLHLQEYAAPKKVDAEKARQRLQDAVTSLQALFGLPDSRIHIKSRQRQKGRSQYQKLAERRQRLVLAEGEALLLVNLDDYLDTGVFLDHRPTRLRIAGQSRGLRFLNLFCYTGAATVHAALGGARQSTSVDMSPTYLNWARENLHLNGIAEAQHRLVQSDCISWLRTTREQFDLIFVDPPTFSNSKRMQGYFDVQAAHVELLDLAMKRLEPGGLLIFSNNFNRFQLASELSERYAVKDVTTASLPLDFARGKPAHRCWEFRHAL
ncbi:MAG: bifunctional 23S rRNA (guanine(2069)-N(7))-methyltransferase RlmK/23S rRNA (guanine(2445)-N(2))-methyltransferase RlmL [Pseudomonadota bacterium]|nr:bifunctional 23S rRNA (guanine(2069)-N(7))-methyltransferase RlmK/23S rRNA (guanine(2445)-N(2))-methyltransferase RlmL [Pseudomonadales bacterium]MDY6918852.1 bifunctional 23S rRNA (guanine(2069)-N(7))-methyltransferase RlmK/23S rRNA (guanine(2445)-N(2))-methyltransferase RlmL [Pseudomonadota bacterium]